MDKTPGSGKTQWADAAWVLAIGGQAGFMLACPVLGALALGYVVDRQLGTLPWITLVLTLVGMVVGPVIVYRWVVRVVKARVDQPRKQE